MRSAALLFGTPLLLALALALGSCTGAQPPQGPAEHEHAAWGYEADNPAHWAELDESYARCAKGEHQSPIDLPEQALHGPEGLTVAYQPDDLRIVDNG